MKKPTLKILIIYRETYIIYYYKHDLRLYYVSDDRSLDESQNMSRLTDTHCKYCSGNIILIYIYIYTLLCETIWLYIYIFIYNIEPFNHETLPYALAHMSLIFSGNTIFSRIIHREFTTLLFSSPRAGDMAYTHL